MVLKSFYGDSVREALVAARQGLGPDAILLSSRRTAIEWKHCGEFEVVCTLQLEEETGTTSMTPPSPPEIAEEIPEGMTQAGPSHYRRRLLDMGFEAALGTRIALAARTRGLRALRDPKSWRVTAPVTDLHLRKELVNRIKTDAVLFTREARKQPLVFVGPSGAGKTTLAVKVAVRIQLAYGITAHFVAADAAFPADCMKLQQFSTILGAAYEKVHSSERLQLALQALNRTESVFVDMPAISGDAVESLKWAQVLRDAGAYTLLVMPATLKPADMSRAIGRYRAFEPRSIAFTHADETSTFGSCISESAKAGIPIACTSGGSRIPEDLVVATAESIVDQLFERIDRPETLEARCCGGQ
jgi:flagellar biosynthesis GTPase FlhF